MKKHTIFLSLITLCLVACSSTESKQPLASSAPVAIITKPPLEGGELLIAKSDCVGCHQTQERMIGPSYQEIAAKYKSTPENIKQLADKIIKGGKGVWGDIPMTPHPNISKDNAEIMIKYILSLKK